MPYRTIPSTAEHMMAMREDQAYTIQKIQPHFCYVRRVIEKERMVMMPGGDVIRIPGKFEDELIRDE